MIHVYDLYECIKLVIIDFLGEPNIGSGCHGGSNVGWWPGVHQHTGAITGAITPRACSRRWGAIAGVYRRIGPAPRQLVGQLVGNRIGGRGGGSHPSGDDPSGDGKYSGVCRRAGKASAAL